MMKSQLFGSSWCISAIYFATINTPCKTTLTATLENVSNVEKTIKASVWIIRHLKFCVEIWRDFYFPASKILVFHVKGGNVVARNEIRMGGAVRQIVHILYIPTPYLSLQLKSQ
jgi:hypothetical protein